MPLRPLTRGSAPGPRWGLRPPTPTIQKKSPPLQWTASAVVDRRMTASEENSVLKRRRAQVSVGRLEAFDTCLRAGVHAAVDSKVRSGGPSPPTSRR